MFAHKLSCRWCRKMYTTAANYSIHIQIKHPEHAHIVHRSKLSQPPSPTSANNHVDVDSDTLQHQDDGTDQDEPESNEHLVNLFQEWDHNSATTHSGITENTYSDREEVYVDEQSDHESESNASNENSHGFQRFP